MLPILTVLACAGLAAASPLLAASATASATGPNPTQVYINSITYGGTGCPQGSVGSFISADRTTFTLIFDSYVASIGPDVAATETRKNCQLNVDLEYPSGFQYSVLSTEYRGYADLDAGVTGVQKATYYFSGQSAQVSAETDFKGPMSEDYDTTDTVPFSSVIWSPCGAALPLNINSQVRLTSTSTNDTGLLTDDSIDGKITFVVGLQWQTCKKK